MREVLKKMKLVCNRDMDKILIIQAKVCKYKIFIRIISLNKDQEPI